MTVADVKKSGGGGVLKKYADSLSFAVQSIYQEKEWQVQIATLLRSLLSLMFCCSNGDSKVSRKGFGMTRKINGSSLMMWGNY